MAFFRYILFVLVISVGVGLIVKYGSIFIRKLKRTEEKAYDKLEKKVLSEKKKPKSQKKKK